MLPSALVGQVLLAAALGLGLLLAIVVLRRLPRAAFVVWIAALCLLPIWVAVQVGFEGNVFVPVAAASAIVIALTYVPVRGFTISPVDGIFVLILLIGSFSLLTGDLITVGFLLATVTYFVPGYLLGRVIPRDLDLDWVYAAVAIALSIVALLALLQFATGFNPVGGIRLPNPLYTTWAGLRDRGGAVRAEATFGNSIALGSSMAIGIPLLLGSRLPTFVKAPLVLLLLGGSVVSISRAGMIGAALGLVLSVAFLRDRISLRARAFFGAIILVGGVAVFPPVSNIFEQAGDEATGSSAYRGDLLSLVPRMSAFGLSASAQRSPSGELYFDDFRSIDSQLILTGLTSGFVPALAIIAALAAAVILVLTGRATPPTLAIAAQIPALTSVALITQWAILFCFVAGLAVVSQQRRRQELDLTPAWAVPASRPALVPSIVRSRP